MAASNQWINLTPFPNSGWTSSAPVMMNTNEFIRISDDGCHAIHKYNVVKDEWIEWIKYPEDVKQKLTGITIAFDEQQEILYICSASSYLVKMNIKTNESKTFETGTDTGHSARAVIVNGTFHIIGGFNNTKHLIFDEKKKAFTEIHEFKEYINWITQPELIYLKSKDMLVFMGGLGSSNTSDSIYSYDLKHCKWQKLQCTLPRPMHYIGCIVSKCEKYVVILDGGLNDIHILNTETFVFTKCNISCPKGNYFQAINMDHSENTTQLLVNGYIKNVWKFPEFSQIQYPPKELLLFICDMLTTEYIHLMETDTACHWKIKLDVIISSSNCL